MPLIVDATMATPYLCRPIEHGADIVIHSATKFLGGHGTTLGGVVVESGRFDWGNGRFPQMTEPVPSYGGLTWWGNFQEYGFLTKLRAEQLRDIGATLSPHTRSCCSRAWRRCRSGWTAHVANARRVAEWLAADPRVACVATPACPTTPTTTARAALPARGPGRGVRVRGARAAGPRGERFIESVQLCSHLANIGDARTLVLHPASTTHQQLTRRPARATAGVPAGPRPHLGRARGPRGHPLGPRPGPRRGREGGVVSELERPGRGPSRRGERQADPAARPAPWRWSARRRTRRARSNFVATYLLSSTDYEVWFVNPNATEILGRPVYPSLADLPGVPDLVDVFRRPEDLAGRARRRRRAGGRPHVLAPVRALRRGRWPRAARRPGCTVVMDRCLKIEHARFHGGLHLAGFDTGVITSRRRS